MRAIHAVGSVLQEYDSDKNIPLLGFGATLPYLPKVSHCFGLNGNIFMPEVHTIDGVLAAYQKNLSKLSFSGPTNFAEVIRYVGDMAYWHVSNNMPYNYFVLMIITDGVITDINETINEIVRCSGLPMSVIIVGVGRSDFSEMDRLDADTQPLYSSKLGKYSSRDIVQFVPFLKFESDPQELARKTLAELPKQLVDYMTAMRLPPQSNSVPSVPNSGGNVPPTYYAARQIEFSKRVQGMGSPEAVIFQTFIFFLDYTITKCRIPH